MATKKQNLATIKRRFKVAKDAIAGDVDKVLRINSLLFYNEVVQKTPVDTGEQTITLTITGEATP